MQFRLSITAGVLAAAASWLLFLAMGGPMGSLRNGVLEGGLYLLIQFIGFGTAGALAGQTSGMRDAALTGLGAGLVFALLSGLPRTLLRFFDATFMVRIQQIPSPLGPGGRLMPDFLLGIVSAGFSALFIDALLGAAFAVVCARLLRPAADRPR